MRLLPIRYSMIHEALYLLLHADHVQKFSVLQHWKAVASMTLDVCANSARSGANAVLALLCVSALSFGFGSSRLKYL